MTEVKKTKDALLEKPMFIRFGIMLFRVKPLTLAQIYEIGAVVENMKEVETNTLGRTINALAKSLELYENIPLCEKVVLISMFRRSLWRKIWGRFIRKRMTVARYRRLVEYFALTFQAAFFFTSFTFLKGAKMITSPTNTDEVTALGASSEE